MLQTSDVTEDFTPTLFLYDEVFENVLDCCTVTLDEPGETKGACETEGAGETEGTGETEGAGGFEDMDGDVVEEDAMVAPPGYVYVPVLVPRGWLSAMGGEDPLETWQDYKGFIRQEIQHQRRDERQEAREEAKQEAKEAR